MNSLTNAPQAGHIGRDDRWNESGSRARLWKAAGLELPRNSACDMSAPSAAFAGRSHVHFTQLIAPRNDR
jgi:hypothetical protein